MLYALSEYTPKVDKLPRQLAQECDCTQQGDLACLVLMVEDSSFFGLCMFRLTVEARKLEHH